MITVSKFGTFWVVSWQEAEHLRAGHVCAPEPMLRIESVAANAALALKREF